GESKDHAELAITLSPIVPDLVKRMGKYDPLDRRIAEERGTPYSTPELSAEAGQILEICSDQAFCATVVRKQPGFAINLFSQIQSQKPYSNGYCKSIVWELVRQALLNPDSILYREESYRGLGNVHGFRRTAFTNSEFNEHMCPLSGFNFVLEKNVTGTMVKKYGEICIDLLKVFLKSGRYYEHSFSVYSSLHHLSEYAIYISGQIDRG